MTDSAFRVDKPMHVSLGPIPNDLDIPLLRALLAAEKSDDWECFTESILNFNLANTDSPDMSQHIEAVLLVSAFERILKCGHGKEDELAQRFSEQLHPSQERLWGDCARLASSNCGPRFQAASSIREIWIRDFFRLRGDSAHGWIHHRYPAIWLLHEHLLLGSYAFPLLVRSILGKDKLYSVTKDDQFEIDLFERLASECLFEAVKDKGEPPSWPWNKVIERAHAERLYAQVVEQLRRME